MSPQPQADRRRAPRVTFSGRVEIAFEDPAPTTIQAQLVEISSTGFRASHASKALCPGLEVQFRRDGASGKARVVWTHVNEDQRVSGFLILS